MLAEVAKFAKYGRVKEGSALYLPWGWLLIEKTVNMSECGGVRWMWLPEIMDDSAKAMIIKLLPSDLSSVKPNTSLSFLRKIVEILNVQAAAAAAKGAAGKSLPALKPGEKAPALPAPAAPPSTQSFLQKVKEERKIALVAVKQQQGGS